MTGLEPNFWQKKTLESLNAAEWEALCDGCAKCCLHRLEDSETMEIFFTNVCCRYLDQASCRCSDYKNRSINVPDCVWVTLEVLVNPYWLPESCAYRLLAEGKALPVWHPLISGNPETPRASGNAVCGRVISELDADDLLLHLIDWAR